MLIGMDIDIHLRELHDCVPNCVCIFFLNLKNKLP